MIDNRTSKTTGAWEVEHRFRVPELTRTNDCVTLERALAAVDGVLRVSADGRRGWVDVDYLRTKTDYRALEQAIVAAGFPLAAGRWAQIKSRWCQYLDLTGRANAVIPNSACCNKPPTKAH